MTPAARLHAHFGDAVTVLQQVIDDGQIHPWSEVIDRLLVLTVGNRRDAAYLAHLAAHELRTELAWFGKSGSRSISYTPRIEGAPHSARCPACGAWEGHPCWRLTHYGTRPSRTPTANAHRERWLAALEADLARERERGEDDDDAEPWTYLLDGALDRDRTA